MVKGFQKKAFIWNLHILEILLTIVLKITIRTKLRKKIWRTTFNTKDNAGNENTAYVANSQKSKYFVIV